MATTTRSKHKQLVKEAENQRLVQEEENDTDSDYKTNLSESEQEASDQTISDDVVDVIDITDNNDAETSINENILKKRKPFSKFTRPKTSWVWNFFKEIEDSAKVICQIESCEKILYRNLTNRNNIESILNRYRCQIYIKMRLLR